MASGGEGRKNMSSNKIVACRNGEKYKKNSIKPMQQSVASEINFQW